jgi:hypothetical protein
MKHPRVLVRWIPKSGRARIEGIVLALPEAITVARNLEPGRRAQFNFRQRAGTLSLEIFNHQEKR